MGGAAEGRRSRAGGRALAGSDPREEEGRVLREPPIFSRE